MTAGHHAEIWRYWLYMDVVGMSSDQINIASRYRPFVFVCEKISICTHAGNMKYFLLFVVTVAATVSPVLAHHSFAAEFDNKKPIELTGTLVELEWVNPHTWIHMDVTDVNGKTTKWDCEL